MVLHSRRGRQRRHLVMEMRAGQRSTMAARLFGCRVHSGRGNPELPFTACGRREAYESWSDQASRGRRESEIHGWQPVQPDPDFFTRSSDREGGARRLAAVRNRSRVDSRVRQSDGGDAAQSTADPDSRRSAAADGGRGRTARSLTSRCIVLPRAVVSPGLTVAPPRSWSTRAPRLSAERAVRCTESAGAAADTVVTSTAIRCSQLNTRFNHDEAVINPPGFPARVLPRELQSEKSCGGLRQGFGECSAGPYARLRRDKRRLDACRSVGRLVCWRACLWRRIRMGFGRSAIAMTAGAIGCLLRRRPARISRLLLPARVLGGPSSCRWSRCRWPY